MDASKLSVGDRVFVYFGSHYGRVHLVEAVYGSWITAKHVSSGDVVRAHASDVEAAS